jgi:hypothetical protein
MPAFTGRTGSPLFLPNEISSGYGLLIHSSCIWCWVQIYGSELIDFLLTAKRDAAAAKRFFRKRQAKQLVDKLQLGEWVAFAHPFYVAPHLRQMVIAPRSVDSSKSMVAAVESMARWRPCTRT